MLRLKEVTKMIRRSSIKVIHARTNSLVTVAASAVSGRSRYLVPSVQIVSRSFHPSLRALSVVTENLESLGDSITTAVLLKWAKEPGDSVKEDDVIGVVETDKVTMDIRAKKTGVFVGGLVEAGAEISVGSPLYKLDTSVSTLPPVSAETVVAKQVPSAPAGAAPTVSVPVPVMGESITQGVLAKWMVATGAAVKADEVVASIETDKVTVEVRSPSSGVIVETFAAEGDEVNVGNPLFTIRALAPGEAPAAAAPKAAAAAPKAAAAPATTPAPAAKSAAPAAAPVKVTTMPTGPAPVAATGDRSETRVKMTRMRLRIAQRLKEAQNTTAMLTTLQEVDMTNLIAMRNRHKEAFEKVHGVKLGFMSAFVTASTKALMEIPAVNGVIDETTNEIVYRNYCDVSVAVASPAGLVVPVLRNTEKMNFADVEKTIGMYGAKAKAGALALEDMTGGTFTISNGGVFGSLFGTPILNLPQSAILGMHATKMRAMVDDKGQVVARPMMYLALTYDHRLVDGREAVTFLKSVQNKIEDPTRLLLDL